MEFVLSVVSDLVIVISIVIVITIFDAAWSARKRKQVGGPALRWSDFQQRKFVFILLPFAIVIILAQNILNWNGFDTRDDVPYFLGLLVVIWMIAAVAVWWSRRR